MHGYLIYLGYGLLSYSKRLTYHITEQSVKELIIKCLCQEHALARARIPRIGTVYDAKKTNTARTGQIRVTILVCSDL